MDSITSLPSERTAGGLCADDLGKIATFTDPADAARHELVLSVIHHEIGTHGQPITYLANTDGDSFMLPADCPVR
jgi:hypothetical protein